MYNIFFLNSMCARELELSSLPRNSLIPPYIPHTAHTHDIVFVQIVHMEPESKN